MFPLWVQGDSKCASISLYVHLSVIATKCNNFDPVVESQPNYQGKINSSQVILGQMTLTPGTSENRLFCQIYLQPAFWGMGVMTYDFRNWWTR